MSLTYTNLLAALAGVPNLPQAACRGEHSLFESPDPLDIDDAIAICARCPALDACQQWYASLAPRHRPTESTVAGQYRPAPRQKKPRKETTAA
jgi:hypothetical protein